MEIENATDLVLEKLDTWLTELIKMLPNIGVAILIIITGYLIAKLVSRLFQKGMLRVTRHSALLLGYRELLDEEINQAYATAGAMHVLAAFLLAYPAEEQIV